MTIRIGKVELRAVQDVHVGETRSLVEQRVPGQAGSVFQDLGREPALLVLEGLLVGEDAVESVEQLRAAQTQAEPLSFAADVAIGTEITDVLVEDLRIRQEAGHANRYRFQIRLREHIEPPAPGDAALDAVNEDIAADADAWNDNSLEAAGLLQDPGALAGALANNPGLLDSLNLNDLAASLVEGIENLTGADLSNLMQVLSEIDIQNVVDLVQALADADSLGEFLSVLVEGGIDILADLGIDAGLLGDLFTVFADGGELLTRLRRVRDAAEGVASDIENLDLLLGLEESPA